LIVRVENGIACRLRSIRLLITGAGAEGVADTCDDADEPALVEETVAGVGSLARPVVLVVPAPSHAVAMIVTATSAAPIASQRRNWATTVAS
jgi:hypothetical protein